MLGLSAEDGNAIRVIARPRAGKRVLLTHRGALDPCASWQTFGNTRESFFAMTGTSLADHYRRYDGMIHLESAAVRVPEAYRRWPEAHRPEDLGQAAELDEPLRKLQGRHELYVAVTGQMNSAATLAEALRRVSTGVARLRVSASPCSMSPSGGEA